MDPRFIQAHKEALYALALTILYLLGWIVCAYLPENKTGIMGFPLWFELSCVMLPVIFTLLCWLMVKHLFKNIPLNSNDNENHKRPIDKQ